MPHQACNCHLYTSIKRKTPVLQAFEEMITFLNFYFLPSFDKLFIHSHIRNPSRNTLTDSFKAITSAGYDISGKTNSTFDNSKCPLDWAFNETFGWLVDDFPSPLCNHSNKNIWIAK